MMSYPYWHKIVWEPEPPATLWLPDRQPVPFWFDINGEIIPNRGADGDRTAMVVKVH